MPYLDWKVGDRVVFVAPHGVVELFLSGWRRIVPGLGKIRLRHRLQAGEVYRIEALVTHSDARTGEQIVCVFLKGFRFIERGNVAFPAAWFRKVQPRKTDISIFTDLLHDRPVEVVA